MGKGRILNNMIQKYGINIYDPPEFQRAELESKLPYFQRMYRTHNVVYPDILYEGVTKQEQPENKFFVAPIPPSDATRDQLTFAEPSNIITDNIMYEQGVPDIREDYRLTREMQLGSGQNTIVTTEYAPGTSEKIRRDNPVVVSTVETKDGRKLRRLNRLREPLPSEYITKKPRRRYNIDYDEYGKPLQKEKPIYDTFDFLSDLKLTNEDYGEGEVGSRISDDSLKVYEDFLVKGKLRDGWEILTDE